MHARQRVFTDRRAALAAAAFLLVVYSFLAVFSVGGRLTIFGTPAGHNAPEAVHLPLDGVGETLQTRARTQMADRSGAAARFKRDAAPEAAPATRGVMAKTLYWVLWSDPSPATGMALRRDHGLDDLLALRRWYRKVVLII